MQYQVLLTYYIQITWLYELHVKENVIYAYRWVHGVAAYKNISIQLYKIVVITRTANNHKET